MYKNIKYLDVVQVGKVLGLVYFFIFALLAVLAALFMVPFMAFIPGANEGWIMIVFLLIGPFLYGGIMFLLGMLTAWIYNQIAKRIGGFTIYLEDINQYGGVLQNEDLN